MKTILIIISKYIYIYIYIYIYLGQWHIFVPKIVNPHNSRLAVRTFLKFYTMKRVDEIGRWKLWKWFVPKKFVWYKWAILGQKVAHPYNSGSALRMFVKLCKMKGANRYMKILLVVLWEKFRTIWEKFRTIWSF